jgi:replicative DNA helicase
LLVLCRITPDDPEIFYEAAVEVGAQLVILDSIKDLVSEVSLDRSGQAYTDAAQICVANGVEVIALHHPRKATADGRTRLDLDSVYGSAWITAGAGSVIALNGAPGAGIAKLQQLKMPSEEVGPFDIDFDYDLGTVTTIGRRDLGQWIYTQGTATTAEAVRYLVGKDDPTDAEKRKIRRKLNRLQTDGEITSTSETGDMKVWRSALTVGRDNAEGGRSGVGHPIAGGRSPRRET